MKIQKKYLPWLAVCLLILWLGQTVMVVHGISENGFTTLAQGKILFLVLELTGISLMLFGALKMRKEKK